MTASEVCLIITASAKAGLSVLKFGDLQIEFARQEPEPIGSPPLSEPGAIPTAEMVAPLQKVEEQKSTEMDELRLREEQLAELLITDPFAAEEMIRNGDLAEEDHGSDESEE